ncbi:hypothetical protein QJS04_geneDACA013820 [Acorus gramineus]|uniref:HMA domain-containing protein n=1 Tax=Acorus gramineus TaxID=55184 RepID=A0AAV9AUS1_ACOGR|nr:hypothetical protein QJS04_geneDACA013820 [Acorus gramineus]
MKQKIVMNVQMSCEKCRSKALETAAKVEGVYSVAIQGKEKDQVVVIGDGVDAVRLTNLLRKKLGKADIITLGEAK